MFNESSGASPDHGAVLDVLARARPDRLKALAETVLTEMGDIEVITNRTGLVMVPLRDTVENVDFHLGEVLVSEAHITDGAGHVGYGMITGRDLERAMAMAVIDLRIAALGMDAAITAFIETERARQRAEDEARMRLVEATRVEMETF